jgi:dipeptidyl aminopeptidase/acylaminoacyl peptidase
MRAWQYRRGMTTATDSTPTGTPPSKHAAIAERIIGNVVQAGSPAVSPDGTIVAFVVSRVDMAKNKYFSQIWLAAAGGSTAPRSVTNGDNDGQPAWSPDGRALAFVSRRSAKKGESTLHLLPVAAPGETQLIATMKDGIDAVEFSPDGRWIAFLSRTPDARYEAEDESWQAPRKIETFFTRLNGENWTFDRPQHVYLVPADGTGVPRNLTPGKFQHGSVAWLADSSAIVTDAARHETWDFDFANDLYLVPLDGSGDLRPLTEQTGLFFSPSVSPDGTTIAFLGHDDPMTDPQNARVGLLPVAGGDHRWASTGLDRTFQTTAGTMTPHWVDDTTILGTAEDRGQTHLYRVSADDSPPVALTTGPLTVKSFDSAGGTVALAVGTVTEVSDIYVLDAASAGGVLRRLTSFAERYQPIGMPLTWERFAVPTTDGTAEIDAWIMRPAGFDASKQYPLVLNVHGGPHTQYGETFFDEAQFQAQAGFVGAGHPRPPPPTRAGCRLGIAGRERRAGRGRCHHQPLRVRRCGSARHAGRQLRRLHGHLARRHDRHEVQGHLHRTLRQQPVHRGVHERHLHDLQGGARPRPHRRCRGVRAHVTHPLGARHRGAGAHRAQRGRPALPHQPGGGTVRGDAAARQGRHLLPLPR